VIASAGDADVDTSAARELLARACGDVGVIVDRGSGPAGRAGHRGEAPENAGQPEADAAFIGESGS